jgi:hypothetical protein
MPPKALQRTTRRLIAVIIGLKVASAPASAQESLSVYTDVDVDPSTLYGYITTVDGNPNPDCIHGSQWTYGEISGPTGTNGGWEPGFVKYVAVPAAWGAAEFDIYGQLNINCSCWGGSSGSNAAQIFSVPYKHHYVLTQGGSPNRYGLHGDSWGLRCSKVQLTWSEQHSEITDEGVAYFLGLAPAGCIAVCRGGWQGQPTGPPGPTGASASCG